MKRIILFFTAAVLIFSVLISCGETKKSPEAENSAADGTEDLQFSSKEPESGAEPQLTETQTEDTTEQETELSVVSETETNPIPEVELVENVEYREITDIKYDNVSDFSEGLAYVCLGDKLGYIDTTGKEVIPQKYDYMGWLYSWYQGIHISNFIDGLALVKLDGKYGFIDKSDNVVIPIIYDYAWCFREGRAAVKLGNDWGFIDKTGKIIVPVKYNYVGYFTDGMAIVGAGGTLCDKDPTDIYLPHESDYKDSKWGFVNLEGEEAIPCIYDDRSMLYNMSYFIGGVARVSTGDPDNGYETGLVDKTGKIIVPIGKYNFLDDFYEGYAAVKNAKGKYGFIDTSGKEILPCVYDFYLGGGFQHFTEGLIRFTLDSNKEGYMDKNGNAVGKTNYYDHAWFFNEGMAAVGIEEDGTALRGFIDKTGKEVVPLKYNWVNDFSQGYAAVCMDYMKDNRRWGFIDKAGKEVIPLKYFEVNNFSEGLAAAATKENGTVKWGYINKKGEEIVPPIYDRVNSFNEGTAAVSINEKWGYISIT